MGCKTSRGDFFYLPRVSFPSSVNGPQADTLLSFCFSFFVYLPIAWQCYEEISSSHARRRRGIPREMPTANSLVVAMSVEELGLYIQVPTEISMGMSNGWTTSTVREADNDIYFTRE